MNCLSCGFENPPRFKFCGGCGSPLTREGSGSLPQFLTSSSQPPLSYTPSHLAKRILAEKAAMDARSNSEGERKTITALFADIKGSMELIEDLDPEDARSIIDPTLKLMMDAVHGYEGYVTQSMGDGIFALFGAPIAHEDHPQRALYAALRMQQEGRKCAEKLRFEKGLNLQIRVGVNTGEVVVRSIRKDNLHTDYVPVGHSTSLAARMENLATPGSIVVSEHTHKLTEGYFEFKPLGASQVKGVTEPIHIYEVVGVGPLRTRLQVAARRGLVQFVGRQDEMEQLRRAFDLAKQSHGQIMAVMGEAGVGKSRLFHEFKLVSPGGRLVLETFGVAHGKAYPYLPLVELLKSYFQIAPQDDERKKREKVMGKVLALDRSFEDTLPYLFSLLGVAEPNSSLQQMDSQIKRQRTFEAIKRLLLRESLDQPLVLIFEDLHWLDSETQAFLTLLSEGVATARILLLVNYRPEYQHHWGGKTYYTQLRLDPLGQQDAEELLTAFLGGGTGLSPAKHFSSEKVEEDTPYVPLPLDLTSLRRLILEKTEGNPFFMGELVQTLFDQGILVRNGGVSLTRPVTEIQIPPTVQGVLAAHIDRLGVEGKELLQTLAVIGREFSLTLLKKVVDNPEEELQQLLSQLQAAEFIYEQPAFPDVEYTFKHALTQEVAYNTLLIERRMGLHERTAQTMEELFHDQLEEHYRELAYHYTRSGSTGKAVGYLQWAGEQAVQRSAYTEAIDHLTTALDLLKNLPDTPERTQQELTLQLALGTPLVATKGFTAPEVEKVYTRVRELCPRCQPPQLFPVLFGLWRFYITRGEYQTGRELAEQLIRLAKNVQDPAFFLPAHMALGVVSFRLGEFASAQNHLEQGVTFYDPQKHRPDQCCIFPYGQDPGVACLSFAAMALWHLGYPDQALERSHEALTLAHELNHPFSLAIALHFAASIHRLRREGQAVQERTEALVALASEQGFPYFLAGGTFLRGWALAQQGQVEKGITQMHQGLTIWRSMGVEQLGQLSVLLAETYGKAGEIEEGLNLLAKSLAEMYKSGEHWWEAGLYWTKGELLLAQEGKNQKRFPRCGVPTGTKGKSGNESEAEECFRQAMNVAHRQGAKSLELRAAVSLSRLWQQQGKREEAQQMLAEIYGWFTEGLDTTELQEAKALLEELR